HPHLHQPRDLARRSLGPRRPQPTQRPAPIPHPRRKIQPTRLRPPPSPHRIPHPTPPSHHRLRPRKNPTFTRNHHSHRTHPRHGHQPPPPLPSLPRARRRLPQNLLPHPALPASRPAHASRSRHPLGRTSPHLRLL